MTAPTDFRLTATPECRAAATLCCMGWLLREENRPTQAPARPAPWGQHRAITASAEKINLQAVDPALNNRTYAEWQRSAWVGYERVGEVHYGFNLLANLLSRIRLYPAVVGKAEDAPMSMEKAAEEGLVDEGLAKASIALMAELTGAGFASLARKFALNMSVAGECYLVDMPDAANEASKKWVVCSTEEIEVRATGVVYNEMRGGKPRTLPANTYIARIWRENPRHSREPDSSMVGVQDSVEELLMCQRLTRGAARSRMNAGLLFVPDTLTVARNPTTGEPVIGEPDDDITNLAAMAVQDPGNDIVVQLMDTMVTPIGDETNAAGVVPMVLTGPGDAGNAIRHVTFERASDEWLVKRAESALDRILQGIDIPKEIVVGMQAVKYSNAVVIDENLYKSNIEPLALALADSLTTVFLRAILGSVFKDEAELNKVVVWYDPSEIVTRPNSAQSATEGLDRFVLSPAAWRSANGYTESDAPSPEDMATLMLNKVTAVPDVVMQAVLSKLLKGYIDVEKAVEQEQEAAAERAPQLRAVQSPQTEKAQTPADPQRTAIKQVGVS